MFVKDYDYFDGVNLGCLDFQDFYLLLGDPRFPLFPGLAHYDRIMKRIKRSFPAFF